MIEKTIINVSNEIFIPKVVETIRKGKNVQIPLKGFSMNPWLVGGRDTALLGSVDKKLKVGDIVLAELRPSLYALHRIYRINGDKIQLYGDGNYRPDPVIDRSKVLASAVGFYRKGANKLQTPEYLPFRIYSSLWRMPLIMRRVILAIYRRLIVYPKYSPKGDNIKTNNKS